MAGAWRDSRFGQFSDPSFGASLSPAQPSQGVLPSPDASTSASSDQSNGAASPWGMPGLMSQGRSNPGSVYLAEGGEVPDDTQDSGNAAPTNSDPFAFITAALQTGRKRYGLPTNFFGGGDDRPDPMQDAQNFAEGGVVEGEEPAEEGVIPSGDTDQEDQGQQGQMSPSGNNQGAMAYLSGHGAVGPEIAAALEQRVDPQGQMDPSLRKMLAITSAGDPEKAFQVMQHYRQKFNAFGAFAKAALQGAGGRPPNPAAAADALNKAYAHVPDGTALQFTPAQGGMQVNVRNVMPGQEQNEQPTQNFAEGGPVNNGGGSIDDEDFNMETAGSQSPSGSSYDRGAQASAAQDDYVPGSGFRGFADAMTPKRDPNNATQNFILSIPALLGWQSKAGQFDSVVDKGAAATLDEASKQQSPPGVDPNAGTPVSPGAQGQPQVPINQEMQAGVDQDRAALQADFQQRSSTAHETPPDAKAFGAKVGTEGGKEGFSLTDVLHEIDQAYPSVGMAKERALARAAARQHWADNRTKIEAEQTKSTRAENVAHISAGARQGVANTQATARVTSVGMQQAGAGERNANTVAGKERVADKAQAGQNERFNARESNLNDRAIITNRPGALGSPEKMNDARKGMGPAKQVGAGQQQQPTQGTGPAPTSVPPAGMKYQQSKDGTKWRLVPIQ